MVHTKKELARLMTDKVNVTQEGASIIYDALIEVIYDCLERDGEISLPSIGTFKVGDRAFYDPTTATQNVSKVLSFSAVEGLKAHVKGKIYDKVSRKYIDRKNR